MHGSSFKARHFGAKELLKLNNTTSACLIVLNIIFLILFLVIKYLSMFNMSNLSTEL